MHQRLQTGKAKIYKKLRSRTVEPVLGTLINFTGMKRIWTRGMEQANKFMLGAAIAYNLKKWLHYKPKTSQVMERIAPITKSAEKRLKKALFFIFATPQPQYLLTI